MFVLSIQYLVKYGKGVATMNYFTINFENCKQDGLCATECPSGIIRWQSKGSYPVVHEGSEQFCLQCGHCIAICPKGAISWSFSDPQDCPPIQTETIPSVGQIEHMLKSRRSIRSFQKNTIDHQLLQRLIDTASYAPSGHNLQPVHWIVVENPAEVQKLASLVVDWMRYMIAHKPEVANSLAFPYIVNYWEKGFDKVCHNAPHLIIAHAPKKIASSTTDCVIALTYLDMAAFAMGIGTCWAGYFTTAANVYPPLAEALEIPEDHRVPGALLLGYPQYKYRRIPRRNEPKVSWR